MSKKKAIVIFFIFVGIGVAIVFLFPTFSIMNIPIYLQDGIIGISQLPMQVLASIGGAIASVSVVIGKLWSKLTQTKQQLTQSQQQVQTVENLVNSTQNYATEQIQNLNKTITAQEVIIKSQAEKIHTLETNPQELAEAQRIVTQQAETIKTQTATINTLEKTGNIEYVRLLQEALRKNNIPVPSPETNTVTIIK